MKIEVIDIEAADGTRHASIVDADRVFTSRCVVIERGKEIEKTLVHYPGAVDCGTSRGGEMRVDTARMTILEPRPCLAVFPKGTRKNSLEWLGVSEASATALLRMAASGTNVQADFSNGSWTFGGPVKRGAHQVWNGTDWIIAWGVNWWERMGRKGEERIADLAFLGIHITAGNLRQKLKRMGLVTARKR